MKPITLDVARLIAREAGQRAAIPCFYREQESAVGLSRCIYYFDETVGRYRDYLSGQADNLGHGLSHSELVALDAGAIVAVELGEADPETAGTIVAVQTAGLLHDIRREESNHAERSAEAADEILTRYGMDAAHRAMIVGAIRNHEAFKKQTPIAGRTGQIISDSLYDADKFRWGPDNFVVTLWDMLEYARIDVGRMLAGYRRSLQGIERIKGTFRTRTGKQYGPEFIDIGLAIGEVIYRRLTELQEGES